MPALAAAPTSAPRRLTARQVIAPIVLLTDRGVFDADGREWAAIPEAWRSGSELCQNVVTYRDGDDAAYVLRCRQPSAFAAGGSGLCSDCWFRSLAAAS